MEFKTEIIKIKHYAKIELKLKLSKWSKMQNKQIQNKFLHNWRLEAKCLKSVKSSLLFK